MFRRSTTRNSVATRKARLGVDLLESREVPAAAFGGQASAVFANPTPASAVTSGVGTNQFTWGTPADSTGPSSISFTGKNWDARPNQIFSLGTLSYFNGTITSDSGADGVDFQAHIAVQNPAGMSPQAQDFNFHFDLVNTPNVDGDPQASADYVTLADHNELNSAIFTDPDGNRYRLQLVGFGTVRGRGFKTTDEFHILEGQSASAQLLGKFVSNIDLATSVDSSHIVPVKATDLHLLSMFGTEQVQVPVSVENQGVDPAHGKVNIKLYMSTSDMIDDHAIPIGSLNGQKVDLQPTGEQEFQVKATIPSESGLKSGEKYYVLARVTPVGFKESDVDDQGKDQNNDAASSDQYEFLGTPKSNPAVFSKGLYFSFARRFLKGQDPPSMPHPNFFSRTDLGGFIAAFEGKVPYPYKVDGKGNTTIGIGMEIPSVIQAGLLPDLKAAVQSYTAAHGDNSWAKLSDAQFVARLNAQANRKDTTQIMSMDDVGAIFAKFVTKYTSAAQRVLDKYGVSPNGYQWVALVDVQYNLIGGLTAFPSMLRALHNNDDLEAAFQLVDASRTTQYAGLTTRTEAELGNILFSDAAKVGNLV
jgi:GH24 family phage-related lysozyme (muramidase)